MVSGCNSCEALIGAASFFGSDEGKFIVAWNDSRYTPFHSLNDAMRLYTILSQNGRSVFSVDSALEAVPRPLSRVECQKKMSGGWKIFISAPANAFATSTHA